jgi:phosphate uptake regulator
MPERDEIIADSKRLNEEVDELWTLLLMRVNGRPEHNPRDVARQAKVVADLATQIGERWGKEERCQQS